MSVAGWLSKLLQIVPLNTLEASPPDALRAAHNTRPLPSVAQLGPVASDPFIFASIPQVVPLKTLVTIPPFEARAAQTACPVPVLAQLGAELIPPASFVQPVQVEPLNAFTTRLLVNPLAAHAT